MTHFVFHSVLSVDFIREFHYSSHVYICEWIPLLSEYIVHEILALNVKCEWRKHKMASFACHHVITMVILAVRKHCMYGWCMGNFPVFYSRRKEQEQRDQETDRTGVPIFSIGHRTLCAWQHKLIGHSTWPDVSYMRIVFCEPYFLTHFHNANTRLLGTRACHRFRQKSRFRIIQWKSVIASVMSDWYV